MEVLIGIFVGLCLIAGSIWFGTKLGTSLANQKFLELSKEPIAGQTVNVRGIGDVFILGRGFDDADSDGVQEEYIDYIAQAILNGRTPADLSDEELDAHTVSVPLKQFLLQCDFVRAQVMSD